MQLEECCWKMVQTNLLKPKLQTLNQIKHIYSTDSYVTAHLQYEGVNDVKSLSKNEPQFCVSAKKFNYY